MKIQNLSFLFKQCTLTEMLTFPLLDCTSSMRRKPHQQYPSICHYYSFTQKIMNTFQRTCHPCQLKKQCKYAFALKLEKRKIITSAHNGVIYLHLVSTLILVVVIDGCSRESWHFCVFIWIMCFFPNKGDIIHLEE